MPRTGKGNLNLRSSQDAKQVANLTDLLFLQFAWQLSCSHALGTMCPEPDKLQL